MKPYSVGKFVDMVGVPYSSLRYFERIGLLKPRKNVENNYREYTPEDAFLINRFKFLRSLGFEVKETLELVKARDRTRLVKKVEQKQVEIRRQAALLQRRKELIEGYMEKLSFAECRDEYCFAEMKPRCFLPASSGLDFSISEHKRFSHWVEMLPITEYCQLIQLADSEDVDTAVNNFGISIEEEDRIFLCDEDFSRPVQRIEGGKCLRFASCNRFYPHVETESIQKARLYLVAHGLEMSGDIYVGGMSIPDGEEQEQIIFMPYRKKSL